jgi:hypothetical protein
LRGEYWSAAKKIETEAKSRLSNQLGPGFHGPFAKSPLREWYDLQWEYEQDPEFRATTLARYVPPPLLAKLDAQGSASDARRAESGDRIGWRAAIPAVIAFLVLALVVRAWRRRSARRDVASAPAFEDTAEERRQQQVCVAAAKEVVDTLAPYFAAAQRDGRPLPAGVLSDPGVHAFLVAYSQAAFAALTGVDREKVDIEDALEVLHEIQTSQRQRLPLEGPMPTWTTLKAKLEDDAGYVVSRLEAQGALDTFAGEEYILADLDVLTVEDSELTGLQLRDNPPATRLHPRGPHAGLGQRLVLRALSKNVARLAAEST